MDGESDPVGIDGREPIPKGIFVEQMHTGSHLGLKMVVLLHGRVITGVRQKEVATAGKADVRIKTIDRHVLREVLKELQPVLRHQYVLGQTEQLTNTAICIRRCGELVGWVGLDDGDGSGPAGLRKKVSDRRSDNTAADNQDVAAHDLFHIDK